MLGRNESEERTYRRLPLCSLDIYFAPQIAPGHVLVVRQNCMEGKTSPLVAPLEINSSDGIAALQAPSSCAEMETTIVLPLPAIVGDRTFLLKMVTACASLVIQ